MSKVELPQLELPRIIKDPIHDYIPITALEYKILQLPAVNRLHDLKQTSMAYLVFPGATTTRFQHSIGAMHLASKLVYQILQPLTDDRLQELFPSAVNKAEKLKIIQTVRLAALLHDIGHGPMSHATEDVMLGVLGKKYASELQNALRLFGSNGKQFAAHEFFSYMLISKSEIAETISDHKARSGEQSIGAILPGDVAALISKAPEPKADLFSPDGLEIARKIISSQLDADRMDYLVRDGYMTGVSYGLVDVNRVIMHLLIKKDKQGVELAVHERALGAVEDMLDARFKMYKWLYSHHLVASANALLEQAIDSLVEQDVLEESDFHWTKFAQGSSTDSQVMSKIVGQRQSNDNCRALVDRRYLPVSLLKRPSDHIKFEREIMEATRRGMHIDLIALKLKAWFKTLKDESTIKVKGRIVSLTGVAVTRSPYNPLRHGDTVWVWSDGKLSELSHFSEYFRSINVEWTHFPSYFISYTISGKSRQEAGTKEIREKVREQIVSDIANA